MADKKTCPHTIVLTQDIYTMYGHCAACFETVPLKVRRRELPAIGSETPQPVKSPRISNGEQVRNMPYERKYAMKIADAGVILQRLADKAEVYLQGDDCARFVTDIEPLGEIEYPYGPFKEYQEHLDYIISQYDDVMQKAEGA